MKRGVKIFYLTLFTLPLLLFSQTFEEYSKEQNSQFTQYLKDIQSQYLEYKEAYNKAYKEYSKDILEKWPKLETTTKYQWVEYDKDYNTKKKVDFEKEELSFEVIADNEEDAKKRFKSLINSVVKDDVQSAYKNDQLQQNIEKIIKTEQKIDNKEKIIGDVVSKKYILKELNDKPLIKVKNNDKFIYKLNVKLPPDSLIKKAKRYKTDVVDIANKNDIPVELVYAVIHSESSFNPMARSYVPAFGLMQIVPKTAGVDTYRFLYGKEKLLSSNYLYNAKNNITIGTTYIHIIYFRYMKKIENPISRMYCTIAAYNTGAGNVARTFIGNKNINEAADKINKMTPDEVYSYLLSNLPYNETRKYLVKVNSRVSSYKKLLENEL